MARIPSLEETLSQIRQSIGLDRHTQEKRFSNFELGLENHTKLAEQILDEIFTTLDMGSLDREHASENIMEWANFQKGLELNLWTGDASQQQVLWHLLAYTYAPALARRLAFWSIANDKNGLPPIDAGMPGGRFWFLPNADNHILEMPVTQVINWLLDLLGGVTVYSLKQGLSNKRLQDNDESVIRTLYNWHKNGLPKNAGKIDTLFADDASLVFEGTFSQNNAFTLKENFEAALNFVKAKNLDTAEKLCYEIPIQEVRLEAILNGKTSDEEKKTFIERVTIRYQVPAMRTIRKRLKIARMMQDGYKRLLKFLCPNVSADCIDPDQNKLLQIIALFEMTYNLTVESMENADSHNEQDDLFESKLAPWDKDFFVSVLPFRFPIGYLLVAERLTRIFMSLERNSPLENFIPWNDESALPIINRRLSLFQQQFEEDKRLLKLRERVRISSPRRTLSRENSFWVLSQFASQSELPPSIQKVVLKRLNDLVVTEGQKVSVNIIELGYLLNGKPKFRPKDIKQRVSQLIDKSEQSAGCEQWQAPLLNFRAKHKLFQNDFAGAIRDFKAALTCCSENAFGSLRGEIARDCFATELADNSFIKQNQEIYYRNIIAYMEFPNGPITFEDVAVECEEHFWDTLYEPYSDVKKLVGISKLQYETILETLGLIHQADWDGFRSWLLKNAKKLRNKNIKGARRDSVLLSWLKNLNTLQQKLPQHITRMAFHEQNEVIKLESFIKNWRKSIAILLEAWPEQAKIADFKGQTPLMLVADKGDIELTNLIAPLSDVDMQDYKGRTALHSAAAGRCPECVSKILDLNPLVSEKITFDEENTALHTAVRFGEPNVVSLIYEAFPGLADQYNNDNQTPLVMARGILDSLDAWQEFMLEQNRRTGSKNDFINIISELSSFPN